jgi:hypothetical protein
MVNLKKTMKFFGLMLMVFGYNCGAGTEVSNERNDFDTFPSAEVSQNVSATKTKPSNGFENLVKETGSTVENGLKQGGKIITEGAKQTFSTVEKGLRQGGELLNEGAKQVVNGVKTLGTETQKVFQNLGGKSDDQQNPLTNKVGMALKEKVQKEQNKIEQDKASKMNDKLPNGNTNMMDENSKEVSETSSKEKSQSLSKNKSVKKPDDKKTQEITSQNSSSTKAIAAVTGISAAGGVLGAYTGKNSSDNKKKTLANNTLSMTIKKEPEKPSSILMKNFQSTFPISSSNDSKKIDRTMKVPRYIPNTLEDSMVNETGFPMENEMQIPMLNEMGIPILNETAGAGTVPMNVLMTNKQKKLDLNGTAELAPMKNDESILSIKNLKNSKNVSKYNIEIIDTSSDENESVYTKMSN